MLRYAITNRARAQPDLPSREQELLHQVEFLAQAGVDFIQLREKDLESGALAALARSLLTVLRSYARAPRLLINSRADVAIAIGADGVHLTSVAGELTPAHVRRLYSCAGLAEPILSVSCHSFSDIPAAREANLILFGPVFEKVVSTRDAASPQVHVSDGTGLDVLRLACVAAAPIPVLALGGVTLQNASSTLQAGAAGVAAIRMFQSFTV